MDLILAAKTRREQQTKIEKISLVAFLSKEQRRIFYNICRRLKRNDKDFYQNKNLHVTLFGFGPLEKKDYERIGNKIQQFSEKRDFMLNISFDTVRPGSMYPENKNKSPRKLNGLSNGTVIAVGDVIINQGFWNFTNELTSFLLSDEYIKSILGANFRRKFPTVWCTLGYYNKKQKFKIGNNLEKIFNDYRNLDIQDFNFPVSEISLVISKYKNLRYPRLVQKFKV